MASLIQNFTIFLKYEKFVKRICVALSEICELYDIAIEKFEPEIGDALIELYLEDKEFAICCELEDLQQLYHGAIVEIRIKESSASVLARNLCEADNLFNDSFEKQLNLDPQIVSNINTTNEDTTNTKSPTWSSIVSSTPNWSAVMSIGPTSTASTTSTTPSTTPENENIKPPRDTCSNMNYRIPSNRYYVLLTGVPFTSTHQDIASFFNPLPIYKPNTNGIFFVINCRRQRIGHVFVVFPNKKTYEAAFELNGHYIAGRCIQILECKLNDFKKCVKISKGINMTDFVENGIKRNHVVMKLKGFSFDIDEYRITEWLNNKSIAPVHVHIMYDYQNRNSGVAYLEFKTKQNANRVFQLNNEYLGCRYINVFISTLNELRIHLAQLIGCPLPHNLNPYLNCLRIDGVPNICKEKDVVALFKETLGIIPKHLYIKSTLNIAYAEFKTQFECQLALTRDQSYINCADTASLITLIQVSKYELRSCVGDVSGASDDNNQVKQCKRKCNDDVYHHNNKENVNNTVLVHRNNKNRKSKQNHIISIRGIPFDSDKQDVLNFFKGYDSTMISKSLRFLKDHKGRFSGQATIAFRDRQQALRVVQQLDRKYIGSRYVLLRLFQ